MTVTIIQNTNIIYRLTFFLGVSNTSYKKYGKLYSHSKQIKNMAIMEQYVHKML